MVWALEGSTKMMGQSWSGRESAGRGCTNSPRVVLGGGLMWVHVLNGWRTVSIIRGGEW